MLLAARHHSLRDIRQLERKELDQWGNRWCRILLHSRQHESSADAVTHRRRYRGLMTELVFDQR